MEKKQSPLWITKYFNYSESYGYQLINSYGFSDLDVSVYMFLFTNKLFNGQSKFNSYKISQELTKLAAEHMLEEERPSYNAKAISQSLNRLVGAGFVTKFDIVDKKLKGTTPKSEFQTKTVPEIRNIVRQRLDTISKNKFNTLTSLEDIEENVDYVREKGEK